MPWAFARGCSVNPKGQGAIEYLLIIAGMIGIVILVVLIVNTQINVTTHQIEVGQDRAACFTAVGCKTNKAVYNTSANWYFNPTGLVSSQQQLAAYLFQSGFKMTDQDTVDGWMLSMLGNGSAGSPKSVIVFTTEVAPESVLVTEPPDSNCNSCNESSIIRRYLDAGGTVVWVGQPPGMDVGRPGGPRTVGKTSGVFGYDPGEPGWPASNTNCPITPDGVAMNLSSAGGISSTGNMRRVNVNQLYGNFIILANETDKNICTWLQNFNPKYPYSGLLVIGPTGAQDGSVAEFRKDVLMLATWYPGRAG